MESDIERLFHFTKEASTLESILTLKEFWVSFCIEDHRFLNEADEFKCLDLGENENKIKNVIAYPIVSFCDIPLDRIKNHVTNYGQYGIGMKRKWAKSHNISPVQYISEESLTARLWLNIISQMQSVIDIHPNVKDFKSFYFDDIIHLATYIKPYRNGDEIFYNEREWRYYPPEDQWGDKKTRFLIRNDEVDEITEFMEKNKDKKSAYKLPFEYDDIDFLIVPDEMKKNYFIELFAKLGCKELKIRVVGISEPK